MMKFLSRRRQRAIQFARRRAVLRRRFQLDVIAQAAHDRLPIIAKQARAVERRLQVSCTQADQVKLSDAFKTSLRITKPYAAFHGTNLAQN